MFFAVHKDAEAIPSLEKSLSFCLHTLRCSDKLLHSQTVEHHQLSVKEEKMLRRQPADKETTLRKL